MRFPKPGDSCLLRMPNEILHLCFEQVAYLDRELAIGYEYYNSRYKNANTDSKGHTRAGLHQGQINVEGQYALALTCRRFHDLVTPILYTTVRLDAHEFCQSWSHQRVLFFRTIDENLSLKLHIKDLTINWDFECVGSDTIRYLAKLPNLGRLALWKMKVEPGMIAGPLPVSKYFLICVWTQCQYLPGERIGFHAVWEKNKCLARPILQNQKSPSAGLT